MDELLLGTSPLLLAMVAWGGLALWFDGPRARVLAGVLAGSFVLGSIAVLFTVSPMGLGFGLVALAFAAILAWWLQLKPSNDRDWQPDVSRTASAEFRGDAVTIRNLRNFDYANGVTPRWEVREFDLRQLEGVDLYLCYWGPRRIAHTIISFSFEGQRFLPISIEARREKGESYSPLRSFFRQFELYYVVGDERDVIRLRTNLRGEQVFLYRLTVRAEHARTLLVAYLEEINRLGDRPRWYNALTTNCTTVIRVHTRHIAGHTPWDWRLLVNGYVDRMAYERGTLDTSLPFEELRARSDISERARAADGAEDFSTRIRHGIPDPRVTRTGRGDGSVGKSAP